MVLSRIFVALLTLIPSQGLAWLAPFGSPYPVFTPDGEYVLFIFDGHPNYSEVYRVPVTGVGSWRELTRHSYTADRTWYGRLSDLTISLDGEKVSYVMEIYRDGSGRWDNGGELSGSELFVMDISGYNEYVLEAGKGVVSSPSFSPDGSRVAYLLSSGGSTSLCIKDINGMNKYVLADAIDAGLAYADDGKRVIFAAERSDRVGIFEIKPDGTKKKLLCDLPAYPRRIVMSPDGKKLAVVAVSDDGDNDIYLLNADGTGLMKLVGEETDDTDPVFTPDGERIVYTECVGGRNVYYRDNICIINVNGSDRTELTTEFGGRHPAVSPDGTKICYVTWELCLMNIDGTGDELLVPAGFQDI